MAEAIPEHRRQSSRMILRVRSSVTPLAVFMMTNCTRMSWCEIARRCDRRLSPPWLSFGISPRWEFCSFPNGPSLPGQRNFGQVHLGSCFSPRAASGLYRVSVTPRTPMASSLVAGSFGVMALARNHNEPLSSTLLGLRWPRLPPAVVMQDPEENVASFEPRGYKWFTPAQRIYLHD